LGLRALEPPAYTQLLPTRLWLETQQETRLEIHPQTQPEALRE
jgi:hypothetical protein